MKAETTYRIYRITDDGLLKEPTGWPAYGQERCLFNKYGYQSHEEAATAILLDGGGPCEYAILPTVTVRWEPGD
jgi:hypothetical protein